MSYLVSESFLSSAHTRYLPITLCVQRPCLRRAGKARGFQMLPRPAPARDSVWRQRGGEDGQSDQDHERVRRPGGLQPPRGVEAAGGGGATNMGDQRMDEGTPFVLNGVFGWLVIVASNPVLVSRLCFMIQSLVFYAGRGGDTRRTNFLKGRNNSLWELCKSTPVEEAVQ